ncbi:uncharacterized protein ACN2A1_014908 [Glossina fuscipes fuscipes]
MTISRKRTLTTIKCKTEICNNYDWNEDDDDIFASISIQEILHQDVKVNNNFPHTSKFPVNKQITQGNHRDNISGYSKSLVLRETNVALGLGERPELGEDKNTVGVSVISIENESEEVKSKVNRDEVGKVNNPESSLVSEEKMIAEKIRQNDGATEQCVDILQLCFLNAALAELALV